MSLACLPQSGLECNSILLCSKLNGNELSQIRARSITLTACFARKKAVSLQTVTPENAAKFVDKATQDRRYMRPVSKSWVDFLAREMKRGMFMPTSHIALGHLNGDTYILNGNHTLRAIQESGERLKLPLTHYHIEDESELADLYAHFDINKKRTFTDSLRAYEVDRVTELSMSDVQKLASAVKFIVTDFGRNKSHMAHDEVIREVVDWAPTLRRIKSLAPNVGRTATPLGTKILSRGYLSVALINARSHPEKFGEFWERVATDDALKYGDPRKVLHRFILLSSTEGGGATSSMHTSPLQSAAAIKTWLAWLNGRNMKSIGKIDNLRPTISKNGEARLLRG